ncbi:MAG: hypothetical protein OXT67_01065 [Zetaproteobacteria bacterium]|nr:hypothetical protein [Zetaproteobacteria bacterium]
MRKVAVAGVGACLGLMWIGCATVSTHSSVQQGKSTGRSLTPYVTYESVNQHEDEAAEQSQREPIGNQIQFTSSPLSGQFLDEGCLTPGKSVAPLPVWMPELGVVATRYLKSCMSSAHAVRGVDPHTPWVAMGFPCTAGEGKIEVAGHYWGPKIVGFDLGNDCKMLKLMPVQLQEHMPRLLGLQADARVAAHVPFGVQYWEIPEYRDAKVGSIVELRTPRAKKVLWRDFLEGQDIQVNLYGRENAFNSPNVYSVRARLRKTTERSFALMVDEVKKLDRQQEQQVLLRCEKMTTHKKCAQVFDR